MADKEYLDKEAPELRLLCQICINDLEHAKRRQWALPYYGILTYAAIVAFYSMIAADSADICWFCRLFFLLVPAFGINILVMWHLFDTHRCMCQYRITINEIERTFEYTPRGIWSAQKEPVGFDRYLWGLTVPLVGLIIFGLLLVVWLIFGNCTAWPAIVAFILFLDLAWFIHFFLVHSRRYEDFKRRRKESQFR